MSSARIKSGLIFGMLALLATATTSRATDGTSELELAPLIDLDLGYLSVDPQMPWAGDPFRGVAGYAEVKPEKENFELGGIVYNKTEPMAVVNGENVEVGDEIDGRVVESIGRNYVILRKGDSLREVVLPPDDTDSNDPLWPDSDKPGSDKEAE